MVPPCLPKFLPPIFSVNKKEQWKFSHFIDGNGITGPDWGHSEVVFNWVLLKRSHHARFSLEQSAAYSSRQRVNLIESGFIIVRDNPFVNLYRKKTLPFPVLYRKRQCFIIVRQNYLPNCMSLFPDSVSHISSMLIGSL